MIDETAAEIRGMQTHSSSVVAVKATRALEELLDREYASIQEFERDLEQNAGVLRRANTSHASLYNALREVERAVVGEATTVSEAKSLTAEAIDQVIEEIERGKRKAAENAAALFEDGTTFLTHDYSTTVLTAVENAAVSGAELTAYVTEARPRFIGRRTARKCASIDGVEPHLIVDSAAGHYLTACDRVVVGMDCIVDDVLYNRVGTFPIAAAANELGVPVAVVGSGTKVITEGFRFENEYRSASEVSLEPIEDVIIDNPAYDATPVDLIDQIVTDDGVESR